MDILSEQGRQALAAASREVDPGSLGAAGRMRKQFSPELAAAALTQVALRRRATTKLPRAGEMVFTSPGLEQATRYEVAVWRAQQFRAAGVDQVFDLGCGIGADSMAFLEAGLEVHAVEADPDTAALATENLALLDGRPVVVARAEDVDVPDGAGVFLDPARRTDQGRTWRVEDFSPPWSLALHHLRRDGFCCVKMGPGLPKELIPDGVRATWVSHHGDVVEASLWNGQGRSRAAVDRMSDLVDRSSDPWIAGEVAQVLTGSGPVVAAVTEMAGRVTLLGSSISHARPDELAQEIGALQEQLRRTTDPDVRREQQRALSALDDQADAVDRLLARRDAALAQMHASTVGLEGLATRTGELVALGSAAQDTDEASRMVADLTDVLDAVRAGVDEARDILRDL